MKHMLTSLLLLIYSAASSQWLASGNNIYNSNSASVGIGTGATPYTSFNFNVQAPDSTTVAGSLALFISGPSVTAGNLYGIFRLIKMQSTA